MNENSVAPKKPLDKKVLIIGAVVLVVVIALIVILVKPGNGGTGSGGGGTINQVEETIVLTGKDIGNNKILVTANSTKSKPYDVTFALTFYDENNERLREFGGTINAIPVNGKSYYTIDTAGLVKGKYTFDFEIKESKELSADKVYSNKFTTKNTKKDNEIIVEFTNGTDKEVDSVHIGVLYYNGNELINFTSQSMSDVGAGYTFRESVYIPTDVDGKPIKFDKHEVVITAYDNE